VTPVRAERLRITAIVGAIVTLHVVGWTLYRYYSHDLAAVGGFVGAGTLAYALGVRHAFDADHIAAIDDTTRLMLQRGRRPVGIGFFFAMGHSTVVLVLALIVALAAGAAGTGIDTFQRIGGIVSQLVAMSFLLLVATLNALVLAGIVKLSRRVARGQVVPGRHPLRTRLGDRQRGRPARALRKRRFPRQPAPAGRPHVGYLVVGAFLTAWLAAAAIWRYGRDPVPVVRNRSR
jgi:high-affinity nickel-transport protein